MASTTVGSTHATLYLGHSLRALAKRCENDPLAETMIEEDLDLLYEMALSEDPQFVKNNQKALELLSFLSIALAYRDDIERRWAKDNNTDARLKLYGIDPKGSNDR